jgi:hypothetical protein
MDRADPWRSSLASAGLRSGTFPPFLSRISACFFLAVQKNKNSHLLILMHPVTGSLFLFLFH